MKYLILLQVVLTLGQKSQGFSPGIIMIFLVLWWGRLSKAFFRLQFMLKVEFPLNNFLNYFKSFVKLKREV